MSLAADTLRRLAIDLIAPRRTPDAATIAAMEPADWTALTDIARQHRILPLMHARLRGDGAAWPVPQSLRDGAAEAFRTASFRAIRARRALVQAVQTLTDNGVATVGLKGVYLAFHAYADAGLRPLRDIDLLVPQDRAVEAWQMLLATGIIPNVDEIGDINDYLKVKHQLPALWCPVNAVTIELHHRAFHGSGSDPDVTDDPGFADALVRHAAGGVSIAYMGPEHLLLHLIVHSAHDHRFDNGPGIFADVESLLATHRLDWAMVWRLADRYAATRAAVLVLRMAEMLWGAKGIEWREQARLAAAVPPELIDLTARLSLRDRQGSAEAKLLARIDAAGGRRARLRMVAGKLVPPPALLRAAYPNQGKWRELPGLYWRKWRDLAGRRALAYADALRSDAARADREGIGSLTRWLDEA